MARDPFHTALDRHMRDLTVLFMDIAGCTRLCELLPSEEMQGLIQEYFSSFIDDLHDLGRTINETAGDGLIILFLEGGPTEHARNAARAATLMHARTRAFGACHGGECRDLAVHIGINSGVASLGVLELQGSREARATYTASGPTTNVAARLAALAPGGETYVSAETYARLGHGFEATHVRRFELKNVGVPLDVYGLSR